MFGGILAKVLGAALIGSLIWGGVLYVQNLRKDKQVREALTRVEIAEAKLQVAEKTIKIFKEWDDAEKIIESTSDPDLIEYFRTGVLPNRAKAGDRPAALPGQAPAGEYDKRQK